MADFGCERTTEDLNVAMVGRLVCSRDLFHWSSRGRRGHFKAFKQPLLVCLKVAGQNLPLRGSGNTIAVNDLAQNRLIDTDGFGKLVLMAAAAENLKFKIREHRAFVL